MPDRTGSISTAVDSIEARRWQALALCLLVGFMILLDVSIVNVALPSIQSGLDASPVALTWVVSGYVLAFGLVLVPAGRLGDDRGRARMFVLALVGFTLASALAGLAQNELWLVIARLLQGIAGGMLNPQMLGLMQQLFRGSERGKAFGLFGMVVGISTAIGPLVGGLIIEAAGAEHGWRWVFFVNLPVGVIAVIAAVFVLPRDAPRGRAQSLDLVGVLLLGGGLLCLLLPLVEQEGGDAPWYLLAVAVPLLVLFVWWEHRYRLRGRAPLVDLRLLNRASYSFGISLGLLYFAGFTSIFFVLALYFQRGLGYSALAAGLVLTPFSVGSAISSVLSGRLVHRFGRSLVVTGLVTALSGLLLTELVLSWSVGQAGLAAAVPLLLAGIGSGMVIAPNQTVTLSEVEVSSGGTAAGLQQTGQRLGSAVGTAAASGLFFAFLPDYTAAITQGLLVSLGFVAAALLLGVAELVVKGLR